MNTADTCSDTASVATTSSLSSRISLLKERFHYSSSPSSSSSPPSKKGKEEREREMKDQMLRSQIRIGI